MKKKWLMLSTLCLTPAAFGSTYNFQSDWPTHYVFDDGTNLGIAGKYQYDDNHFSNDGGQLQDAHTNRRKELGIYLKKKGVYTATATFDFQSKKWLDVYLRVQSKAFFGTDAGAFRVGYSKTPVGFEANTSTGGTTFMETALPTSALFAGRRVGVDWALIRPEFLIDAGYYSGGDLQGGSDGHMVAARFAWTPVKQVGKVLHLGISASRESPQGSTDGRDTYHSPSARFRSYPEAGLAGQRLVDSGALPNADYIDRRGFEGLWINGPWSLQAEYLDAKVNRDNSQPAYHATGYYAFASWVLTGESRRYSNGNVGNVKPHSPFGAVELALRYSELNLDDNGVFGGQEHDLTFGANWYINRYLKLQANYVHADSNRRGVVIDPNVLEMRAQIQF